MAKLNQKQLNRLLQHKVITFRSFQLRGGKLTRGRRKMKINLSTKPKKASISPRSYVIDQLTHKRFYFDRTCTVPTSPATLEEVDGGQVFCYASPPALAPFNSRTQRYLHPSRMRDKDKTNLRSLYIKELRSLESGCYS